MTEADCIRVAIEAVSARRNLSRYEQTAAECDQALVFLRRLSAPSGVEALSRSLAEAAAKSISSYGGHTLGSFELEDGERRVRVSVDVYITPVE